MQTIAPCISCKHLMDGIKCKAFPKGIPEEIFILGESDHTEPFKGDNGIQFEPIDEASDSKK